MPNFNSAFAAVRSNLPSSVLVPDPSPVSVVFPAPVLRSSFISCKVFFDSNVPDPLATKTSPVLTVPVVTSDKSFNAPPPD